MNVLLSWLREFAPIEGDPVELGNHLSDLGLAVEEMRLIDDALAGIEVVEVLETMPHPNADKVQLVNVDRGDGEALQIVCGAFNMAAGDKVPLATLGTVMPNGMEIARRKMRGEWSNGMLCSATEIGLGADHAGILILPADASPGDSLADSLDLRGEVFYELEVNPNRPDASSMAGVARDLAARLRVPFALPDPDPSTAGVDAGELATVEIVDGHRCGRFVARVLADVPSGPSPQWMQRRLLLAGMRPISYVVDVSNYVMLELGQPNHAYDLDKLGGSGLRVRVATEGETMVTLDEVERTFTIDDLLICDAADQPIGIAGIMGGASTEISEATERVLLELAWFDAMGIARTSKRLGLRSEASARFERGCDPLVLDLAARRFAELLAPATLHPGVIDTIADVPNPHPVPHRIIVRPTQINALLGTSFSNEEISGYLEPIGFGIDLSPGQDTAGGGALAVDIPTFRPDTATEVDIAEEVARHHGYSAIPLTLPRSKVQGGLDAHQQHRRRLRALLIGAGCDEVMPQPWVNEAELVAAGLDPTSAVQIANPLTSDDTHLRPSLLPGLARTVGFNESHRNLGVSLFEVGTTFRPNGVDPDTATSAEALLPIETERLGAVLAGGGAPAAKALWDVIADALGVDGVTIAPIADEPGTHPTRTAQLASGDRVIGIVGELDPAVAQSFDIGQRVGWLDLDVAALREAVVVAQYRAVSRYPSSDVDLAFIVDDGIGADLVESTLSTAGGPEVRAVDLFDVYRGDQVADGARSLAFTVRLQADDRTLTDDEASAIRQRMIDAVAKDHGAVLR